MNTSVVQLPNLPGIRRGPLEPAPKIYSKSRPRGPKAITNGSVAALDEISLASSYQDFTRSTTVFPSDANSFNDVKGRYSLRARDEDRTNKKLSLPFSTLDSAPAFVVNPKGRVCHFSAYFTEVVPENLKEPSRSRIVEIIHYVEDNTFEIIEPIIRNSGLIQGKMLRRSVIQNELVNRNLKLSDVVAGAQLKIFGKVYTIINCDTETKRYVQTLGWSFGQPLELDFLQPDYNTKDKRPSKTSSVNRRLFDGDESKILKYNAIWDDNNVQLQYSVADNTISVYEIKERNKKVTFDILLKKTKVQKENLDGTEDASTVLITTADEVGLPSTMNTKYFLHWTDLVIGATIPMAGMQIRILDVDRVGREFYEAHGMKQGEPIIVLRSEVERPPPQVPPHTGFGSYDDSLTSCKGSLVPHAARKDLAKMKQFEGIKLQFRAIMVDPPAEEDEKPREFVLVFFMEDDHFQILEQPEKNSGRIAGNFLSKCKLHKKDGSLVLQAKDIFVGARLPVNSYTFYVYDAAEKTHSFMESRPDLWPSTDVTRAIGKLFAAKSQIREAASDGEVADQVFDAVGLNAFLNSLGLHFEIQEVVTLIRFLTDAHIDSSASQSVTLTRLVELFEK